MIVLRDRKRKGGRRYKTSVSWCGLMNRLPSSMLDLARTSILDKVKC